MSGRVAKTYRWRYWFIIASLSILVIGLLWRMVDLTILQRDFLLNQGDARVLRNIEIPAHRGIITDRNGEPLAVSTPVDSVWFDPKTFAPGDENLLALSDVLDMNVATIKQRAIDNSSREFVYLKRGLNPAIAQRVRDLKIPGIYLQREYRRYYPDGEVTAQVLGFTNIDDQGQEGLELAYDRWLQGKSGAKRVMKDRLGRIIADIEHIRSPDPGRNLVLSIDRRVQYLAYRELKAAMKQYQLSAGSIVVLDARTNEVLAMVNQPSFNPNSRPRVYKAKFRNRAVTDVFEPGSTLKSFSVANALINGDYTPETIIDTSPGWMRLNNHLVQGPRNYGKIDLSEVLRVSSNVGITKATLTLPANSLWETLNKFGFGQSTEVGFPGESTGVLVQQRRWSDIVLATLSFGYGLSTTSLQLARAYSVFAADGVLRPVSLLRLNEKPKGEQIMSPEMAQQMLAMLEGVAKPGGTARRAKVTGYRVGGKTGTTEIAVEGGYDSSRHVALFAGIAPISSPRLVVVVMLNDPQGKHYFGSVIAAPVFSKVMGSTLRLLNIAPDGLEMVKT